MAIVDGQIERASGIIDNYLGKKREYAGQTLWGAVKPSEGLAAVTEWQCLKRGELASLVACFPKTGRTHQLRVHLADLGHPILGDFQYGKDFQCPYRSPRILLHAEEIGLRHPQSGAWMEFHAAFPEDFQQAKDELFKG